MPPVPRQALCGYQPGGLITAADAAREATRLLAALGTPAYPRPLFTSSEQPHLTPDEIADEIARWT